MVVTHLDTGVDASHLTLKNTLASSILSRLPMMPPSNFSNFPFTKVMPLCFTLKFTEGVGRVNLVMRLSRKSENGKEEISKRVLFHIALYFKMLNEVRLYLE